MELRGEVRAREKNLGAKSMLMSDLGTALLKFGVGGKASKDGREAAARQVEGN